VTDEDRGLVVAKLVLVERALPALCDATMIEAHHAVAPKCAGELAARVAVAHPREALVGAQHRVQPMADHRVVRARALRPIAERDQHVQRRNRVVQIPPRPLSRLRRHLAEDRLAQRVHRRSRANVTADRRRRADRHDQRRDRHRERDPKAHLPPTTLHWANPSGGRCHRGAFAVPRELL
jgi:hypothetical protein